MNLLRKSFALSKSILRGMSQNKTASTMSTQARKDSAKRIVWVDLEMTGLNIDKDHILEIACLVTDADLNLVATGPNLVIHQPDSILNNMDSWCIATHGESGLTEASRKSKISLKEAEKQVLEFVSAHVPEKKCPLGGNSVYMDRLFLRKYMPNFDLYLHYRIIDVSTIKELARRWYQKEYSTIPKKKFQHRSIDDIFESIAELRYYRDNIFKLENNTDIDN
ncbi:oligoribonuclease, mitochondrial [Ostrinia furnacalis]|uniref:oligoribonuclease, mitochondrial n=1 Tax=Ostrinia furnacalis TaxID=93504 RepID=UPI00103CABC3|nr:oligoribonuclease, mitochondrial [Ostrinia furnacalis]